MKVLAPGKLILSGEHAVVYGKPALAMAVDRYTCTHIIEEDAPFISFELSDLSYKNNISLDALDKLKNNIKEKYQHFKNNRLTIREVLQNTFELAQFALSLCLEKLSIQLSQGLRIHITSTIPMGCGMGSSASTILSVMHAVAAHSGVSVSTKDMHELALQAEHMQHGQSSGLDLHLSLRGGCHYIKDKMMTPKPVPSMPFYLINTGTPQSSTGECVSHVAHHFKESSIGDDFANTTDAMRDALDHHSWKAFKSAIEVNHDLLNKIGVVPERVKHFIQEINKCDGAAKICGAGAISGNHAGIVMAVIEDESLLKTLCDKYGYIILPVKGEARGVHVSV